MPIKRSAACKACKWGVQPDFETHSGCHQKTEIEVPLVYKKDLRPPKFLEIEQIIYPYI